MVWGYNAGTAACGYTPAAAAAAENWSIGILLSGAGWDGA